MERRFHFTGGSYDVRASSCNTSTYLFCRTLFGQRIRVSWAKPRNKGGRGARSYSNDMRCYGCGRFGHLARNCFDRRGGRGRYVHKCSPLLLRLDNSLMGCWYCCTNSCSSARCMSLSIFYILFLLPLRNIGNNSLVVIVLR